MTSLCAVAQAGGRAVLAAAVRGSTGFALDLYRRLRTGEANLFFSPYSISTALAMTYAGAGGTPRARWPKPSTGPGQRHLFQGGLGQPVWPALYPARAVLGRAPPARGRAVMALEKAMPEPAPVFRADHPFVFLIREDRTGSILFLGRVVNPRIA